jgi:hypothetical protein
MICFARKGSGKKIDELLQATNLDTKLAETGVEDNNWVVSSCQAFVAMMATWIRPKKKNGFAQLFNYVYHVPL